MRAATACVAVPLIVSLTACANNGLERSASDLARRALLPTSSAPAARSGRGNPPFYDVLGKRYHVLPTSAGYAERGVASWYGGDFHGLATSSGELYDMHAMTAAHTRLPLPTWVEVTNLVNGKRVVVKVNDRGPFVDNRLIDLSYAAATALDMVRTGTTRVEVRTVAPPLDAFRDAPTVAAPRSRRRRPPSSGCSCRSVHSQRPRTPSASSRACARAASPIRPSSASPPTGA